MDLCFVPTAQSEPASRLELVSFQFLLYGFGDHCCQEFIGRGGPMESIAPGQWELVSQGGVEVIHWHVHFGHHFGGHPIVFDNHGIDFRFEFQVYGFAFGCYRGAARPDESGFGELSLENLNVTSR